MTNTRGVSGSSARQRTKSVSVPAVPVVDMVREFYEAKGRTADADRKASRRKKRSPAWTVLALVLCVAAWVIPPNVIQRQTTLDPEKINEGARVNMYLAALDIESFRARYATLPTTLGQLGLEASYIKYQRLSDTNFLLTATVEGSELIYRSGTSKEAFLGSVASQLHSK